MERSTLILCSAILAFPLFASDVTKEIDAGSPSAKTIRLGRRDKSHAINPQAPSALILQQTLTEGYSATDVDLENVDAYFGHIFARLPDEATIYPSENYYYFIDCVAGRQIWGNIRVPAGKREQGILAFGYSEFNEFPSDAANIAGRSKYFTERDGVTVKNKDPFTWMVSFKNKTVTFHLHKLSTEPPHIFALQTNEVYIERTFDESGIQFFLLFNTNGNYFFWVLNEEEIVPDEFIQLEKDVLVGRRTGFVFWLDREKKPRKVLASVRKISVARNDYYDGPFDQLADNYVDQNRISQWMERAFPSVKGRIDKYGYFTDVERPSRVALSCYGNYETQADVINFVRRAKASPDPYQFISRGGVSPAEK